MYWFMFYCNNYIWWYILDDNQDGKTGIVYYWDNVLKMYRKYIIWIRHQGVYKL